MKSSSKIILYLIIIVFIFVVSYERYYLVSDIINNAKTSILSGIKTVRVTEDKVNIEDKDITMVVSMPVIHYKDKEVERYINTYIRKNINQFINYQKQTNDLRSDNRKVDVSLSYHVAFEDKEILNLIIYKEIKVNSKSYERIKDSYIFDLKTGQRIYLDNFLKDNEDYNSVIENYIIEKIDSEKRNIDKDRIVINKYTNYYISGDSIGIYFNQYKSNRYKETYDFKVPYNIFNKKIKKVGTNPIVAQVDTQTITNNKKYINSIINIPIVRTDNKSVERKINSKIKQDIMNSYYKIEEEAKRYYKGAPKEEIRPYIYNVNFEVKKNSDNMLSIVVTYYQDSGGAHGFYENESYNFYTEDGNNLTLDELFIKDKNYKMVIDNNIIQQVKNMSKEEDYKIYDFRGIKDNQKFYIQDDNIVIYFDLYEIAPYVAGIPEFFINISDISHIVKEKYIGIFK